MDVELLKLIIDIEELTGVQFLDNGDEAHLSSAARNYLYHICPNSLQVDLTDPTLLSAAHVIRGYFLNKGFSKDDGTAHASLHTAPNGDTWRLIVGSEVTKLERITDKEGGNNA